uniref:PNPLA domain-containing protein n=1 Tax=Salvator merianae TaxID=96440 RepID=A0A8D0E737_SALMN
KALTHSNTMCLMYTSLCFLTTHFYPSLPACYSEVLFYGIACDSRRSLRSPFFPGCNVIRSLQKKLHQTLPENSHQMATGRLYVSLTRLIDGQNVVVSEYSSKEELIQVLICSCFVPIYAGFIPPSFRGVRYVDGGFTNLQPCSDLETAITVSPFTGETDICPRDCPAIFYSVYILQANIQISLENLCRFCYALFPPSWQVSCFSSGRRYVAGGSPSLLCTGSFRKAGKAEQLREVASTTSFCQLPTDYVDH